MRKQLHIWSSLCYNKEGNKIKGAKEKMEKNNEKKPNKLKEEKGAVAALVLITIVGFLIVLTAFYFRSTQVRQTQLETDSLLKNIYESQVNDEITAYSWKSYVQDGLILHYDGINNTGNGHADDALTWRDLSGKGHNGTLKGINYLEESGWKENCLKFDTVDDWVDTLLPGDTTFTPESDFTMTMVVDFNALTNEGDSTVTTDTNDGDTGVLLGAMSTYAGYGIFWMTNQDDNKTVMLGTGVREYTAEGDDTNYVFNQTKSVGIDEKVAITFVYSHTNQTASLYVNGALLDEKESLDATQWGATLSNIVINQPVKIQGDFAATYADIDVYSARIYNTALTADQIEENFKVDRQRFQV